MFSQECLLTNCGCNWWSQFVTTQELERKKLWHGDPTRWEDSSFSPSRHRRWETVHLVPTKVFLKQRACCLHSLVDPPISPRSTLSLHTQQDIACMQLLEVASQAESFTLSTDCYISESVQIGKKIFLQTSTSWWKMFFSPFKMSFSPRTRHRANVHQLQYSYKVLHVPMIARKFKQVHRWLINWSQGKSRSMNHYPVIVT